MKTKALLLAAPLLLAGLLALSLAVPRPGGPVEADTGVALSSIPLEHGQWATFGAAFSMIYRAYGQLWKHQFTHTPQLERQ